MPGKNVHVVKHDDGRAVKKEGNDRASSVHPTQQKAIDAGRDKAHGGNGIVKKLSFFKSFAQLFYGLPLPPAGQKTADGRRHHFPRHARLGFVVHGFRL